MFNWKIRRASLDPIFRIIYVMEFIAVIAMFGGLFLVWWSADEAQTAWQLLERSTRELRRRDVNFIAQPLLVLWLMWPVILLTAVRSFTGLLVQPVAFRRAALGTCIAAALPLLHYYVNYGESLDQYSPLRNGEIGIGFWLTACSTGIIAGLVLLENLITESRDPFAGQLQRVGPVDQAEALWQGEYVACPFCGMLNDPKSRACYNCKNLLFNFDDEKAKK